MAQEWTEGRLDELSDKVDRGFEGVDRRFEKVDADIRDLRLEMKEMRNEVNGRLDSLQRVMIQAILTLTGAILAGFAAICALLATQL